MLRNQKRIINRRLRYSRWAIIMTIVLSVALVLVAIARAAPGDLDPTFGTGGKVIGNLGGLDYATATAIQNDGKIIVAGSSNRGSGDDFAVVRYHTNGFIDNSFGTNGQVITDFLGFTEQANAVALQPDGKIVVAGYVYGSGGGYNSHYFGLVRYNVDGTLDNSFGIGGKVMTDFRSNDIAWSLIIQPNSKIIAIGETNDGNGNYDFALARYNQDGSLDSTFGVGGKVTTAIGLNVDAARAAALQPDGKIVVNGNTYHAGDDFALVRYNIDGSLDNSFGLQGKVITNFGALDFGLAIALQPDGKIISTGRTYTNNNGTDFALARYHSDGSLDSSFGLNGKVTTHFFSNDDSYAVAIQPNGKIVAAGFTGGVSLNDFAMARYNTDGSFDNGFGANGKVTTSFGNNRDEATAVAIQPDGRIVVAGSGNMIAPGNTNPNSDFALARFMGDLRPNLTSNFDTDRKTDIAIWNPANGDWQSLNSTDHTTRTYNWGSGALGDKAVPGDYDGDGRTDLAVFRPSEGNWYIVKSSDGTATLRNWGNTSDLPVPGDYDLDGKTDVAVYRPSEGNWYVLNSRDNTSTQRAWGASGDKPVPADYDGDGATDLAVYRPAEGNWYIITSKDRFSRIVNWGIGGDKPVPADYDGDGRADAAVYRPAEGTWFIRAWTNNVTVRGWGDSTDIAVPADYDGDGKADIAVFRPSESNWYIIESGTNSGRLVNFGQGNFVPVPAAYLPQ
jgi:uncharacterized delta-60 repeat protein